MSIHCYFLIYQEDRSLFVLFVLSRSFYIWGVKKKTLHILLTVLVTDSHLVLRHVSCVSLAILSQLSRFQPPAVGTNWPILCWCAVKHQTNKHMSHLVLVIGSHLVLRHVSLLVLGLILRSCSVRLPPKEPLLVSMSSLQFHWFGDSLFQKAVGRSTDFFFCHPASSSLRLW